MDKEYFGVFSKTAAKQRGTDIWIGKDGKRYNVTGVYSSLEAADVYPYEDKEYIRVPLVRYLSTPQKDIFKKGFKKR